MALGADGGRVRRMVLGQVGTMTLVGGAIGILAALGLGRLAPSLLFELAGHDPAVRLRGGAADADCARRGIHPRPPRVADRSDARAPVRVGTNRSTD